MFINSIYLFRYEFVTVGFGKLRIFDRVIPLYSRSVIVSRIIKAGYILLLRTVSAKMRNGGKNHTKLVALTTIAIVVFVVDATVNLKRGESVAHERTAKENFREDFSKRVYYVGDQVWRIYKHNDSVNDLVEQHDQNGCT